MLDSSHTIKPEIYNKLKKLTCQCLFIIQIKKCRPQIKHFLDFLINMYINYTFIVLKKHIPLKKKEVCEQIVHRPLKII